MAADIVLNVTLDDTRQFVVVIPQKNSIAYLKKEISNVACYLYTDYSPEKKIVSLKNIQNFELPDIYSVGAILRENTSLLAYSTDAVKSKKRPQKDSGADKNSSKMCKHQNTNEEESPPVQTNNTADSSEGKDESHVDRPDENIGEDFARTTEKCDKMLSTDKKDNRNENVKSDSESSRDENNTSENSAARETETVKVINGVCSDVVGESGDMVESSPNGIDKAEQTVMCKEPQLGQNADNTGNCDVGISKENSSEGKSKSTAHSAEVHVDRNTVGQSFENVHEEDVASEPDKADNRIAKVDPFSPGFVYTKISKRASQECNSLTDTNSEKDTAQVLSERKEKKKKKRKGKSEVEHLVSREQDIEGSKTETESKECTNNDIEISGKEVAVEFNVDNGNTACTKKSDSSQVENLCKDNSPCAKDVSKESDSRPNGTVNKDGKSAKGKQESKNDKESTEKKQAKRVVKQHRKSLADSVEHSSSLAEHVDDLSSSLSEAVFHSEQFKKMLQGPTCLQTRRTSNIKKSVTKVANWLASSEAGSQDGCSANEKGDTARDDSLLKWVETASPASAKSGQDEDGGDTCDVVSDTNPKTKHKTQRREEATLVLRSRTISHSNNESLGSTTADDVSKWYPVVEVFPRSVVYYDQYPSDEESSGGMLKETALLNCQLSLDRCRPGSLSETTASEKRNGDIDVAILNGPKDNIACPNKCDKESEGIQNSRSPEKTRRIESCARHEESLTKEIVESVDTERRNGSGNIITNDADLSEHRISQSEHEKKHASPAELNPRRDTVDGPRPEVDEEELVENPGSPVAGADDEGFVSHDDLIAPSIPEAEFPIRPETERELPLFSSWLRQRRHDSGQDVKASATNRAKGDERLITEPESVGTAVKEDISKRDKLRKLLAEKAFARQKASSDVSNAASLPDNPENIPKGGQKEKQIHDEVTQKPNENSMIDNHERQIPNKSDDDETDGSSKRSTKRRGKKNVILNANEISGVRTRRQREENLAKIACFSDPCPNSGQECSESRTKLTLETPAQQLDKERYREAEDSQSVRECVVSPRRRKSGRNLHDKLEEHVQEVATVAAIPGESNLKLSQHAERVQKDSESEKSPRKTKSKRKSPEMLEKGHVQDVASATAVSVEDSMTLLQCAKGTETKKTGLEISKSGRSLRDKLEEHVQDEGTVVLIPAEGNLGLSRCAEGVQKESESEKSPRKTKSKRKSPEILEKDRVQDVASATAASVENSMTLLQGAKGTETKKTYLEISKSGRSLRDKLEEHVQDEGTVVLTPAEGKLKLSQGAEGEQKESESETSPRISKSKRKSPEILAKELAQDGPLVEDNINFLPDAKGAGREKSVLGGETKSDKQSKSLMSRKSEDDMTDDSRKRPKKGRTKEKWMVNVKELCGSPLRKGKENSPRTLTASARPVLERDYSSGDLPDREGQREVTESSEKESQGVKSPRKRKSKVELCENVSVEQMVRVHRVTEEESSKNEREQPEDPDEGRNKVAETTALDNKQGSNKTKESHGVKSPRKRKSKEKLCENISVENMVRVHRITEEESSRNERDRPEDPDGRNKVAEATALDNEQGSDMTKESMQDMSVNEAAKNVEKAKKTKKARKRGVLSDDSASAHVQVADDSSEDERHDIKIQEKSGVNKETNSAESFETEKQRELLNEGTNERSKKKKKKSKKKAEETTEVLATGNEEYESMRDFKDKTDVATKDNVETENYVEEGETRKKKKRKRGGLASGKEVLSAEVALLVDKEQTIENGRLENRTRMDANTKDSDLSLVQANNVTTEDQKLSKSKKKKHRKADREKDYSQESRHSPRKEREPVSEVVTKRYSEEQEKGGHDIGDGALEVDEKRRKKKKRKKSRSDGDFENVKYGVPDGDHGIADKGERTIDEEAESTKVKHKSKKRKRLDNLEQGETEQLENAIENEESTSRAKKVDLSEKEGGFNSNKSDTTSSKKKHKKKKRTRKEVEQDESLSKDTATNDNLAPNADTKTKTKNKKHKKASEEFAHNGNHEQQDCSADTVKDSATGASSERGNEVEIFRSRLSHSDQRNIDAEHAEASSALGNNPERTNGDEERESKKKKKKKRKYDKINTTEERTLQSISTNEQFSQDQSHFKSSEFKQKNSKDVEKQQHTRDGSPSGTFNTQTDPMFSSDSESDHQMPIKNLLSWIEEQASDDGSVKHQSKKSKSSHLASLADDLVGGPQTPKTPLHPVSKRLHTSTPSIPRHLYRSFHITPTGFSRTLPRTNKKSLSATRHLTSTRPKRELKTTQSLGQPSRELTDKEKEILSGGISQLDTVLDDDSFWET